MDSGQDFDLDSGPVGAKGQATLCQFQNHAGNGQFVILNDQKHWDGHGDPPKVIQNSGDFNHIADAVGSIAGVAYLLTHKLKWVVAWSNSGIKPNKVYTEILDPKVAVNWDDIKAKLDNSSSQSSDNNKFGYSSEAQIDANSSTPNMIAKLGPAA